MVEKMGKTEISSTGTRHDIPNTSKGSRITYQASQSEGSAYRLPVNEPSTKDERRRLRHNRDA